MAKKKGKPLSQRIKDLDLLKPFSHEVIAFNDYYHLRITASNGEILDYYPVSEKYKRKAGKLYNIGLSNLIDYLNEVS